MHPSRRRKKRPNYGVRTIELLRGGNGFGFTISGQSPCILSCIVSGSPAERAGLRPGDYLIAVNGLNVSKLPHDDVVKIIGHTAGILKLQISENIFYSDSSEEEFISANRQKPKYPNRVRHKQNVNFNVYRAEKVIQDLQSGALFSEKFADNPGEQFAGAILNGNQNNRNILEASTSMNQTNKVLIEMMLQQRMHEVVAASCANIESSGTDLKSTDMMNAQNASKLKLKKRMTKNGASYSQNELAYNIEEHSHELDDEKFPSSVNFTEQELKNILYPSLQGTPLRNENLVAKFRAVVGYLGTIEMPKEPQLPGSRLQAIRSCIRRLRVEKKVHTLVLLSVYSHQVLLTNPHGLTLAEYPAEKITFSGAYADDKKFFGLVTSHTFCADDISEGSQEDQITLSSSCHVFMVDARIQPHYKHMKRARIFHIECSVDTETNQCQEFPESAEPILYAISALCRSRPNIPNVGNEMRPLIPEPGLIGAPGLVNVEGHLSPPNRSNTSSNSSNSDSGIGFRDEAGSHGSDRMFIVDLLENAINVQRNQCAQQNDHRLSMRSIRQGANLSTSDSSLHQIGKMSNEFYCNNHPSAKPLPKSARPSPLTVENLQQSSAISPSRLTVRVMPDPVGYENSAQNQEGENSMSNLPNIQKSRNVHKYTHKKQVKKQSENLMNVRATCDKLGSKSPVIMDVLHNLSASTSNKNQPHPPSTKCCRRALAQRKSVTSPKTVAEMNPVLNSSSSLATKLMPHKLSPKVFNFAPNSCNAPLTQENVVNFNGENQDVQNQIGWSSSTSQYSDPLDSETDADRRTLKNCIDSADLQNFKLKHKTLKTRSELGTVSDGELPTNGGCGLIKHASSSATSSMIGLERLSSDISTSIQGIAGNTEDMSSQYSSTTAEHERGVDVGRVASWATNFEKLLDDPAGMHTFAEFLKSEFSQENILFWVASERFKTLKDNLQLKSRAKDIYEKHLCLGASEPVNVDSHARQLVQDNLESPTTDLFNLAQKQIYDLMKFDCYSRFLKCQMYKDALLQEMSGLPLSYQGDYTLNSNITWEQLDQIERDKLSIPLRSKDDGNGEEKRKKSIIPWHRVKSKNVDSKLMKELDSRRSWRRRKKDSNKENKWNGGVRDDISVQSSDLTGSRTSLASVDLEQLQRHAVSQESLTSSDFARESLKKDDTEFCRILLPDQSTTVLQVRMSETVRELVKHLIERKALNFTAVDVYPMNGDKALDMNKIISKVNSKEFRVEQRIIFRVDLPNKKTIGVKAKATKNVVDILKPIFLKYGFKLDNVIIHLVGEKAKLNLTSNINILDNKRVIVKTLTEFAEWGYEMSSSRFSLPCKFSKNSSSLNEITNKVFEDLLKGKTQENFDEYGILDLDQKSNHYDDQASSLSDTRSSSSHQSGLLNLVRRSSFHMDYSKNRLSQKLKMNLLDLGNPGLSGNDCVSNLRAVKDKTPLKKNRSTPNSRRLSDNEEMFEVWKRAQRSRLEDQRGTEINGELPDFLKKDSSNVPRDTKRSEGQPRLSLGQTSLEKIDIAFTPTSLRGIIPSHDQAENFFCSGGMDFDSDFSRKMNLTDLVSRPEMQYRDQQTEYSSSRNKQFSRRPVSHPIFGSDSYDFIDDFIPTPVIQSSSKSCVYAKESCHYSSDGELDKTLECAKELDLDSVDDLETTLKVDDSFSPSSVPPPDNINDTSIHVEPANYPPPSPLISQRNALSMRLASPPPLPPKPKLRGPPPRPPSRPQSETTDLISPVQKTRLDLIKQSCRSRKPVYVDRDGADRLNISFV